MYSSISTILIIILLFLLAEFIYKNVTLIVTELLDIKLLQKTKDLYKQIAAISSAIFVCFLVFECIIKNFIIMQIDVSAIKIDVLTTLNLNSSGIAKAIILCAVIFFIYLAKLFVISRNKNNNN